jgi:hypothetical protein
VIAGLDFAAAICARAVGHGSGGGPSPGSGGGSGRSDIGAMGSGHTRISHRLNRTTIAVAMTKASMPQSLSTMLRPIMMTAVPMAANFSGLMAAKKPRMTRLKIMRKASSRSSGDPQALSSSKEKAND